LSPGFLEPLLYRKKDEFMFHVHFILVTNFAYFHTLYFQDTMLKKPINPEEELRWISQEVRGYVEAVLNSLAANVPKLRPQSFQPFLDSLLHPALSY